MSNVTSCLRKTLKKHRPIYEQNSSHAQGLKPDANDTSLS